MPELPEVETTRAGIAPHCVGRRIERVLVREPRLRWPIAAAVAGRLRGQRIAAIRRRAKYLLFDTAAGSLIVHLGMSGSLRVLSAALAPGPHEHVDLVLEDGRCLRYRDPRRFGSFHFSVRPEQHPLLRSLGPEPWDPGFTGAYLHARSRGRRQAVKAFIMDARTVAGVGNIYASEALHAAGIHPGRAAGRISLARYSLLGGAIRATLEAAIAAGGTTLRDFVHADGEPGYFRLTLAVYERAGEPCGRCGAPIRRRVLGQRATYLCTACQR